jgi:hypothetical protein
MDQTVAHPIIKRGIRNQFPRPTRTSLRSMISTPCHLKVVATGHDASLQFMSDSAVMPPQKEANLTQASAPLLFCKDYAAFLGV